VKREDVAIIDAHVHLYPPEVNPDPAAWAAAAGEAHWSQLCTRRRKDGRRVQTFPDVDELLRAMDEGGVTRAVLLGWYWEAPETCRMQNRFYAECVQVHPDRLSAFATIHPRAGHEQTWGEISLARDAGFIGLGELSPHAQGYEIDDPVFRAALELAGELKMPVNLHVTDPASRAYPGRIETPLADFVRLAREFPQTTFILAHWGGGLAWAPQAEALPNLWFDTAASPLLYGSDVWQKARPERVVFGSDYPLILYPQVESSAGFGGLVDEAKRSGASAAVLGQNALQLLGLR
jgi:predicted TIM-barrel fold metal-dependent hydrolase